MADQKTVDEWPEEEAPGTASRKTPRGLRPRAARGLQLQQIDEPDGGDIYAGIGTELRAERQRRQLSIIDVSTTLRIQQSHLSALEEGRTDDLPGPTYAIGFLRTYAEFLGLDGEEIIRQYKREETLTPGARRLIFPEPVEEARRPGLTLALISLIVAGAVYGGWIFLERRGLLLIEIVSEPPQRLAPYQTAAKSPTPPAFKPAATEVAPTVGPTVNATAPQVKTVETPETGSGEAVKEAAVVTKTATAAPPLTETARQGATEKAVVERAVAERAGPGAGERAAAADVSGLANTNEPTITVTPKYSREISRKTPPETRVVEALTANPAHQDPSLSNEVPATTAVTIATAEKMPGPAAVEVDPDVDRKTVVYPFGNHLRRKRDHVKVAPPHDDAILLRPAIEPPDTIDHVVPRCEDQHRNLALRFPQLLEHLEAIDIRKPQVQYQRIESGSFESFADSAPLGEPFRHHLFTAQYIDDPLSQQRIVFNQHYPHGVLSNCRHSWRTRLSKRCPINTMAPPDWFPPC